MSARTVLAAASVLGLLIAAMSPASAADAGAPSPLPACIAVHGEARYIPYGYNHVVVIKNGCTQDAACTISTDVNPQPVNADVKAGATAEVLTFQGSPAQVFTPKVGCRLR